MDLDIRLGGVTCLNGIQALHLENWRTDIPHLEKKQKTPLQMYHGEHDDIIKCDQATTSYEMFEIYGFIEHESHVEAGLSHSIS